MFVDSEQVSTVARGALLPPPMSPFPPPAAPIHHPPRPAIQPTLPAVSTYPPGTGLARAGAPGVPGLPGGMPWIVPAPDSTRRRRRERGRRAGGWLFALLALAGGVARYMRTLDRQETGRGASEAPIFIPDNWDSRVTELVAFVEQHRGLTFEHPVDVQFFAESQYEALFDEDPAATGTDAAGAAADADQWSASMDAAGLAAPFDAASAETSVTQTVSLGFFSFDTKAIYVRGTTLTPALRTVLVHELTHALQEQHFDLVLGEHDDLSVRAMVEADAMRIEKEYTTGLSAAERAQEEEANGGDADVDELLGDVPWALVEQTYAPYVLGTMFLDRIAADGGNAAVDDVLRKPPTAEELVTPSIYGTNPPDLVVTPELPAGADVVEVARPWTMFEALMMLDAWLGWRDARTPFDGWAGAGYIGYVRDAGGPQCFSTLSAFDSVESAHAFSDAVAAWAAASGSAAAPVVVDATVSFEACERGDGAADPPDPHVTTSEAAVMENALLAQAEPPATPEDGAIDRCIARTLVDDAQLADLFWAESLTADQWALVDQRRAEARWNCVTTLRAATPT